MGGAWGPVFVISFTYTTHFFGCIYINSQYQDSSANYNFTYIYYITVPATRNHFEYLCAAVRRMKSNLTGHHNFLITSPRQFLVNILELCCTWNHWRENLYSCSHGCATILSTNRGISTSVYTCYKKGIYEHVYEVTISFTSLKYFYVALPPLVR